MGKIKNGKIENGISRRSFVSGAALGAAGLMATSVLPGCTAKEAEATVPSRYTPSEPENWDYETEFLVLGVGIGGGCAMIEAHDLGLKVMGIEKSPDLRNYAACTWSGGALCGFGTKMQLETVGDEDNIDQWIKDIHKCGDEMGDTEIIRTWGEHSKMTIEWLVGRVGVEIRNELRLSTEHTYRRSHNAIPYNSGYGWMVGVENTINNLGLKVLLEHSVTKIHRNAAGRVIGAEAVDLKTKKIINVKATKGVLASMGGYGNNMDVWQYYAPIMKDLATNAAAYSGSYPPMSLGDGFHMLDEIDAWMYPGQSIYGCGNICLDEYHNGDAGILPHRWCAWDYNGCIWLNKEGKRWGGETFLEYYTERTWRKNTGMCYYMIFDNDQMEGKIGQEYCKPILTALKETGYTKSVFSGDTVEEVATKAGIDAAQTKKTLDHWNSLVTSGQKDTEFGRGITSGTSMGVPIVKPPFWIFMVTPSYGTSKAGGRITKKAEAVDINRKVIPGLYLCGEMASYQNMGSAHQHITGGCNSNASNFGRIAARTCAGVTDAEADKIDAANIQKGPEKTPEHPQEWDRAATAINARKIVATGIYDDYTWHIPKDVIY